MENPEERVPQELQALEARLRAARVVTNPLELDQIKQRVIARYSARPGRLGSTKQRLATLATLFALVGGTGGAVALAGASDHGNSSAANGQYCEGHQKEHGRGHAKHEDCGQGDDKNGGGNSGHGGG